MGLVGDLIKEIVRDTKDTVGRVVPVTGPATIPGVLSALDQKQGDLVRGVLLGRGLGRRK